MTTTLRVVLDQLVAPTDPDLAMASRELTRALVAAAPRGCEVSGVVPAAGDDALAEVRAFEGLAGVESSPIPRRELATAVSLGLPSGLGAGMLHSPTLFAPPQQAREGPGWAGLDWEAVAVAPVLLASAAPSAAPASAVPSGPEAG